MSNIEDFDWITRTCWLVSIFLYIHVYSFFLYIFVPMFSITIIFCLHFSIGYTAKSQWICELLPQLEWIQEWIWICGSWILDGVIYHVLSFENQEIYTDCRFAVLKVFFSLCTLVLLIRTLTLSLDEI